MVHTVSNSSQKLKVGLYLLRLHVHHFIDETISLHRFTAAKLHCFIDYFLPGCAIKQFPHGARLLQSSQELQVASPIATSPASPPQRFM